MDPREMLSNRIGALNTACCNHAVTCVEPIRAATLGVCMAKEAGGNNGWQEKATKQSRNHLATGGCNAGRRLMWLTPPSKTPPLWTKRRSASARRASFQRKLGQSFCCQFQVMGDKSPVYRPYYGQFWAIFSEFIAQQKLHYQYVNRVARYLPGQALGLRPTLQGGERGVHPPQPSLKGRG